MQNNLKSVTSEVFGVSTTDGYLSFGLDLTRQLVVII